MTAPRAGWARAAELFDELAPLTGDQRKRRLHGETVPAEVRRWLDELLEAHDDERSLIIDRQVDSLARSLAPDAPLLDASEYVGQRFGPWRAESLIGRGGMGVVLSGCRDDGQFDMQVAIKVLDPERFSGATVDAIGRELRLLASLEHPGIARLIDGGVRDDGLPYLVMERVDGVSITEWAAGPTSVRERVRMLIQVADAVAHCHARLVVHGDIKPGNVLVDEDGRVRLLDFGIATRLTGAESDASGTWCSPGYAAPERLRGAAPSTAEDVFALGALLYSVLTGTGIRSAPEQTRIVTGRPADPGASFERPSRRLSTQGRAAEARQVAGDLDAVVMKALSERPEDRYASVGEWIGELEAWRDHRPVAARAGGLGYRTGRWIRRNRALAIGLIVGGLALVGGSGIALWQADRARDAAVAAQDAQADAELALARADTVNRFLVDLFQARIPDLPPDQLPTTRQLMDRGIEQARDPEAGPPALRAELLVTLAEILAARRQLDEADGLLDEAAALIDSNPGIEDSLRLRLAVMRAENARNHNRFDDAELRLEEAISLYRALRPDDPQRLELERDRARVLMRRERFDAAEPLLLDLLAEVDQRPGTDDLALRVSGDLAAVAGMTGRPELAFERFERILERKLALDHPALSLATTEVNLAGLAQSLSRYDEAIERFDAVIERLAPFTDVPRSVRAVAMKGRADIARIRGEFAAAEDWLDRAAEEWARVLDLESADEDFFIHYYGARLDAARGRYVEAAERAEVAIQRLLAVQEGPVHRVGALYADRGRYLCRAGRFDAAAAALDQAADYEGEGVREAEREARAVCALMQDPAGADLGSVIASEDIERAREGGGDAAEIARLELLGADLLDAGGASEEARSLRREARHRLEVAGALPDHPLLLRAMEATDRDAG